MIPVSGGRLLLPFVARDALFMLPRVLSNPSSSGTDSIKATSPLCAAAFFTVNIAHAFSTVSANQSNAISITLVTVFKVASCCVKVGRHIYAYLAYLNHLSIFFIAACLGVVFSRAPSSAPLTRTVVHPSEVQWICIAGNSRGGTFDRFFGRIRAGWDLNLVEMILILYNDVYIYM